MWFRHLAVFALATGCAVLVGDFGTAEAGFLQKKGKKAKKSDPAPPPAAPRSEPVVVKPAALPLPTVVAVPRTKDAAALARLIDAEVRAKLAAAKVEPSAGCSDDEYLRRASLDIAGVIPSADKAREFLDSKDPHKREKLIDELLADANYGRRMADIWTAKLFPTDSANRFVLKEPFYKWFAEQFHSNVAWDKLVTSIVTATGTVEQNPATTYFLANRAIDKLTDTTAQHFMGIQLQCAQCHNHPFTEWKQTEYWGMAAFYSKVRADNPKNANKGGDNTKIGVVESPRPSKQKDFLPESAKTVPTRFLGGVEPRLSPADEYRPVLAKWMTAPENPFFSRAIVNRTWAHLFGRGFVNPIDDMLEENTPSHPELLDALARHFATAGGYDLKYLIKAICLSETYQRTSRPTATNKSDAKLFSHMTMKVMTPEQLFDSLAQVTGNAGGRGMGKAAKGGAPKGGPVGARAQFVNFFLAGSDSTSPVDYEAGIPQALRLMNSPVANNPAAVRHVLGSAKAPAEAIERIYLAALSRRPTPGEMTMLTEYVAKADAATTAYGDILWAALNSSEFTLIR
ncbi:MAG TPA: DUF1549 and DUF1553 domain-containing protein [Gemmata sp.]|nr:DUF1549 and DUF1553 domain-containing protein [Gemmata sp.]